MGGIYKERWAVVVEYDKGDYEGPVSIKTSSGDDQSGTELVSNPGFAALTFPLGYSGTCQVEVFTSPDADLLDSFEITV